RILQGLFNLSRNVAREDKSLLIVNLIRLNHHPQLPAGLDGETSINAWKRQADLLQVFQSVDISRHRFRASAGARGADGVGGADEYSQNVGVGDFVVMRGDAVDHIFGFTVTLDELCPDDGVGAFDFVIDGLADVVQQAGPLGGGNVEPQFRPHQSHQLGDFDRVIQDVLRKTVAEAKPAQSLDDFDVHRRQSELEDRLLAGM